MDLDLILRTRPDASEQAPYYGKYIALVAAGNILESLERQRVEFLQLLGGVSEVQGAFRYAPDKWTLKQSVGHVNDTERVFMYRALRIARGDRTPLEGFDQDTYVTSSPADRMPVADLAAEFDAIRRGTLSMLGHLDAEAWMRRGVANGNEVSVRALACIAAGHELHHRAILRERYLS